MVKPKRSRGNNKAHDRDELGHRRRRGYRPFLEILEDRLAPATEILNLPTLQLTPADTTLIEIGGPLAGNPPGGNDVDGYDQVQVASNALLDGTLQVKLVNDYVPEVGTEFDFLTVAGTLSGSFVDAKGLFSFPEGDRYFEIVQRPDGLKLVVTAAPGELRFAPSPDTQDDFGEFLNDDYFELTQFSYTGTLEVTGFASLSGAFAFETTGTQIRVAGADIAAFVGASGTGLQVEDASLGIVIYTPATGPSTFALKGTGSAALTGVSDLTLAGSMTVVVNTTGQPIDETITTPAGDVRVKFDLPDDVQRVEGHVNLAFAGFVEVTGDFSVEKTTDGNLTTITAAVTDLDAFLGVNRGQAGAFGVAVHDASLGLVIEKSGASAAQFAVSSHGGTAGLVGVPGLDLSGALELNINRLGHGLDIDLQSPDRTRIPVDFSTSGPVRSFGGDLVLSIEGFTELSGSLGFEKETVGGTTKIPDHT